MAATRQDYALDDLINKRKMELGGDQQESSDPVTSSQVELSVKYVV